MDLDRGLLDAVLARVDALERELVEALSHAVRIESVNPKYPGQVYDDVVGGEGEVSKFVGEIYRGARLRGRRVRDRARPRERGRRAEGTGGGRSLIYNGHVDVVPPGDPANWTSG